MSDHLCYTLLQVGFVLYNPVGPSWDETEHINLTLATIHFSWHLMSCIGAAMAASVFIACFYRKQGYALGRISEMSSSRLAMKVKSYDQASTPCLCDTSEPEQD
ncbi:transmembrane protein 45A [Elysia marginata]|uniref:Transmembrane protein 45A n=1 Tax=Elysia marginata TaxID=1093978 RepID=A0AAV4JA96_9GAST|nr:transmembrane protein 45A [Elysia marginata]